mgnify:CR=1 FL=1
MTKPKPAAPEQKFALPGSAKHLPVEVAVVVSIKAGDMMKKGGYAELVKSPVFAAISDEIDDEFKQIDDIQAGSNNSKKPIKKKPVKKKSSKKKKPLTKKQRSKNAKNYWRTKKKLQNRMTEETRKKYGLPPKGKKPRKGRR